MSHIREERLQQLSSHYEEQEKRLALGLPLESVPIPSQLFIASYDRTEFDVFEFLTKLCESHGKDGRQFAGEIMQVF